MEPVYVICVDDQREVLTAVSRDLSGLPAWALLEECESAAECLELLDELDAAGERIGVVISDHVMPGESGVELLKQIQQDGRFASSRKVLLTGLATQQDTIEAINQAQINHYLEKPWQTEQLLAVIRKLLTEYLFDQGLATQQLLPDLDQDIARQRLTQSLV